MATSDGPPDAIQITCSLPFPLYIKGSYDVRIGDSFVNVDIKHVKQETFDPRLGIDKGDFDLKIDRIGIAGYTSLEINADWPCFQKLVTRTRNGGPVDFALIVVNKVIDSHRHATSTPWIRRVIPEELFQFHYLKKRQNQHIEGQLHRIFPGGGVTLPRIIDRGNKDFVRRLASDTPPDVWDTLWLDSEDAIATGDTRSAIIFGHSAIETLANATVLAWAREQGLSVERAATEWGRNKSEKGSLKANLSIDELVEFLNDTRKVEIALLNVCEAEQSWGFDYFARFERLAADRNKALHAGLAVREQDARDHVEAVRAIHEALATESNLDRIRKHREPGSAIGPLAEKLGKKPNPELRRILSHFEATGAVITLSSIRRYPIRSHGDVGPVALIRNENRYDIYLRSKKSRIDGEAEKELTRLLIKLSLLQAGWPCATVNERDSSGQLSLVPVNWEGYRIIAECVTDAILGFVEIDKRLTESGFNIQEGLNSNISVLEANVTSCHYVPPKLGEVSYYLLLVQVSLIELLEIERDWHLPSAIESKAKRLAQTLRSVTERGPEFGWDHPRIAAILMLVMLSNLGMFDTIGVSEGPIRKTRTSFTDEELRILKDIQQ